MSARAADERGWVLVTAITLLTVMSIVAFASVAIVDTQQKRAREQRERESSLNLAEAVLYQQGFKLAQGWPTATQPAADCSSTVTDVRCASAAQVQANADNVDTAAATSWTTMVRDNGGDLTQAFRPALADATQVTRDAAGNVLVTCPGPCRYDANGDRKMWVRAQSVVRGRIRTIVATMKLERLAESVPQTAVSAGGINTGNQGAQVKIYAVGSQVVVRCDPAGGSCISDPGAIQPAPLQGGGGGGNFMTPEQIQRFKARAIADGTYHATCPPGPKWKLSGDVVFVENCSDNNALLNFDNTDPATCASALPPRPAGAGNGLQPDCINAVGRPGLVIWRCGGFGTAGKGTFVGVLYFVNGSDDPSCPKRGGTPVDCSGGATSSSNVLSVSGGLGVLGAIAIDGSGCLFASANGIQVQFDPNVFNAVTSYGTVGLVQDTWRELVPS